MPQAEPIPKMDTDWLKAHAGDVSSQEAVVLLQGYPATGFGRVSKDTLELRLTPEVPVFDATYYWDVRLFGETGEWHCWRLPGGEWRGRLAKPDEWRDTRKKQLVLWGPQQGRGTPEAGWICCEEPARGAKVWAPSAAPLPFPVLLQVLERVEVEKDTGLSGVTDAMLRGFEGGKRT